MNRQRAAFSLIELLIVLGILVILSTIGVAAFLTSQKVNRLTATEQLLTSLIRQARYTARASGQAVQLYANITDRTISGVTRLSVWNSQCEPGQDTFEAPGIEADILVADGRTGHGIASRQKGSPPAGTFPLPSITIFDKSGARSAQGNPNRRLSRRVGKPTDGFALTITARPPSVMSNGFAPLVLLAPTDSDHTDGATVGLILRRANLEMYEAANVSIPLPTPKPTGPDFTIRPTFACWEVLGWITPKGGSPIMISSLTNSPRGNKHDLQVGNLGIEVGGNDRWHEYGLVFTQDALELHCDGELIAHRQLVASDPINPILNDDDADKLIAHLGHATVSPGMQGDGSTVLTLDPVAVLDDPALFRIGVDKPARLPDGVDFVTQPATFLVQPNGSIGVAGFSGGSDLTWTVRGVFAEQEDQALITINPTTGLVSGSKIALSPSL